MNKSKTKVGIIGLGFGRFVHLPAFQNDPRCEVVALCSASQGKAASVAQEKGIERSFTDWRELLSLNELDAIAIAVPPKEQPRILAEALGQNLAVFCEKPLAVNLKQVNEFFSGLTHSRPVVMDFEFPFIPAFQSAKELLNDGIIGEIYTVNVLWSCGTRAIRNKLDSWKTRGGEGGVAALFVSHCFLYLEWLVGPLRKIQALLNDAPGHESHVSVTGQFECGAVLTLSVCGHAQPGAGHRIEIFGEQGSILLENCEAHFMPGFSCKVGRKSDSNFEEHTSAPTRQNNRDGRVQVVGEVVSHFLDCIADDAMKCWPSLEEGIRVQFLLDAVIQSHAQSATIAV